MSKRQEVVALSTTKFEYMEATYWTSSLENGFCSFDKVLRKKHKYMKCARKKKEI